MGLCQLRRSDPRSQRQVWVNGRHNPEVGIVEVAHLSEPVGSRGRSGHLILVALPGLARAAVIRVMSTKLREVIFGSRIRGAKIRPEGAREEAIKALREAHRAEAEACSNPIEAYGGPAAPRPTHGQCPHGR